MIVEEKQKTLANNVCVCFVPVVFVYYMYAIFSELSSELHFVEYKPLVKYERLVRLAIWPNTICKIDKNMTPPFHICKYLQQHVILSSLVSFSKECDVSNLSENPCLNGEGVALLAGGQAASFLASKCSLICSKESLNGRVNQLSCD